MSDAEDFIAMRIEPDIHARQVCARPTRSQLVVVNIENIPTTTPSQDRQQQIRPNLKLSKLKIVPDKACVQV